MAARARVLRIGLTGGIASGKSTVARLFARLGVPVIDTDQIARELVQSGTPGLARVVDAFGAGVLDSAGALDRERMRERVFADPAARQRLESILHPLVWEQVEHRSRGAGGPYQLIVVPLLVEAGLEKAVDRVLVVDCPEAQQLARLRARDRTALDQAQRMLAAQASREERLRHADEVLHNDGGVDELEAKVRTLHAHFLALAAHHGQG